MKVFSLTLLTIHDSTQLNRKTTITTIGFVFPLERKSPFSVNVTGPHSSPAHKATMITAKSSAFKAYRPLVCKEF